MKLIDRRTDSTFPPTLFGGFALVLRAGVSRMPGIAGFRVSACFLALTSMACGGAAVPNHQLTTAESAVRAAEVGGAVELPKGELHLKYAKDAIAEARTLMDDGKNKEATLLLDKATVDAEQALALAEEDEARLAAEEQLQRIEELMAK